MQRLAEFVNDGSRDELARDNDEKSILPIDIFADDEDKLAASKLLTKTKVQID